MEDKNNEHYLKAQFRLYKFFHYQIEDFIGDDNNIDQIMRLETLNKTASLIAAAPISSIACCHIKLRFALFYPFYESDNDNPAFISLISISDYLSRIY